MRTTRLPRGEDGEPRYFHPHGYVIERQRRTWDERTGRMQGQADPPPPLFWWTVYDHIAKRRALLDGRPAAFLGVTSERYAPRDFNTLRDARWWCDKHPRDGWAIAPPSDERATPDQPGEGA